LPGIEALIDYGDEVEENHENNEKLGLEVADTMNVTSENNDEGNETKIDQLDEEKRLREEVLKSFQKASQREMSCHVRIDNFQRPLTLRSLVTWLEEKLNLKVEESNIWVNGIKTHCYVTFQSQEESKLCKETIEGLKFPATNPLSLIVNYTKLPANEASESSEAALKYQDWQTSRSQQTASVPISKRLGGLKKEKLLVQTEETAATGPSSLGKRKSIGQGAGVAGAMFGVIRNTLQTAAAATAQEQTKSSRIDRNSTPRGLTAGESMFDVSIAPEVAVPTETKGELAPQASAKNKRNRGGKSKAAMGISADGNQIGNKKELTLDDFFKKTVATPQLYWLPVPVAEVEKRRQQKAK
jgi:hypothetical protein